MKRTKNIVMMHVIVPVIIAISVISAHPIVIADMLNIAMEVPKSLGHSLMPFFRHIIITIPDTIAQTIPHGIIKYLGIF